MSEEGTMSVDNLSDKDSVAILREGTLGRLGCVADGAPYVVLVNYFFDGKDIYIHSLPGKKIDALRAYNRACLQVDEIEDAYHWRSAIAYGTYEEISDEKSRERHLRELFKRLPNMTPVESLMTNGLKQIIVFRIKVEEITGMGEE
jgi:nitroimidazol reductase NimA-like FMN-containing flavoprotein (pyridoxamine 5'-phosphate oxidase superfamily)